MSVITITRVRGLSSSPYQLGDAVGEHTMLLIAPNVRGQGRFWGRVYAIAIVVDHLVTMLPRAVWMYLRHRWQGGCPAGVSCRLLRIRVHVEVTS